MNVLFYVEPLIERSKPYWKEGWATYWCRKIGHELPNSWNRYIALSDALAQKFGEDEFFHVVIFKQSELLQPFSGGFLEASSAWYNNSYTTEQIDYYVNLMNTKLAHDGFDIIITFTPVPFLQRLYPNARILHMEYSIFSRQPFPETWYLDPAGLHQYSFLSKYKEDLLSFELSKSDRENIKRLQRTCISAFSEKNIFNNDIRQLRKKYRFLVLLPVQFSQYYLFDCLTKWKSQFDYVTGVLEQTPHDIGIIFTMHPEYPLFDDDTVSYIESIYPNAIFLKNSRFVYSASQWLMPYVDGVITISSSLGWQTLLFGKKLFALGNGNMNYIADAYNLDHMYEVFERENSDKDAILWFFITKYAIPSEYFFDGKWMKDFLTKAVSRKVDGNFYDYIDTPQKIFDAHIEQIKQNQKNIPQWVRNAKNNIHIPNLYILKEGIYTEEGKIEPCEYTIDDYYKVTFNITNLAKEGKVRFDPLEGLFCCCEIISVDTIAKICDVVPYNASLCEGNKYTFLNVDPIIEISGDFSNSEYITITYKNTILSNKDISNAVTGIIEEFTGIIEEFKEEFRALKSTRRYRYAEKASNFYKKCKRFFDFF